MPLFLGYWEHLLAPPIRHTRPRPRSNVDRSANGTSPLSIHLLSGTMYPFHAVHDPPASLSQWTSPAINAEQESKRGAIGPGRCSLFPYIPNVRTRLRLRVNWPKGFVSTNIQVGTRSSSSPYRLGYPRKAIVPLDLQAPAVACCPVGCGHSRMARIRCSPPPDTGHANGHERSSLRNHVAPHSPKGSVRGRHPYPAGGRVLDREVHQVWRGLSGGAGPQVRGAGPGDAQLSPNISPQSPCDGGVVR
jgi:hypothetical protein